MTNEANFLAAIRENPDDDAVRLIFADWLEDQGDTDRAEFIRQLRERNIGCSVHFIPIQSHRFFAPFARRARDRRVARPI